MQVKMACHTDPFSTELTETLCHDHCSQCFKKLFLKNVMLVILGILTNVYKYIVEMFIKALHIVDNVFLWEMFISSKFKMNIFCKIKH